MVRTHFCVRIDREILVDFPSSFKGAYHSKVSNLADALNKPSVRCEAAEALRVLIDQVVLTPSAEGYDIDLHGDLAGILALASAQNAKTAVADVAGAVSQVSLVAGVGFEPTTFRL